MPDGSSAASDIFGALAPGYSPWGALAASGLGALASMANMGAQRLPYTTGQVVGTMAGGAANALNAQRQAALQAQQLQMGALNLGLTKAKTNLLLNALGAPSQSMPMGFAPSQDTGAVPDDNSAGSVGNVTPSGALKIASANGMAPGPTKAAASLIGASPDNGNASSSGGAMPSNLLGDAIVRQMFGMPLTPYDEAVISASMYRKGSAEQAGAARFAAKTSGVDVTPDLRSNGLLTMWDSTMNDGQGGYRVAARNPQLPTGMTLDDNGNAIWVPGAQAGLGTEENIKAGAKATYEPLPVTAQDGAIYNISRAALGKGIPLPSQIDPKSEAFLKALGGAFVEPTTVHDAAGNAFIVPKSWLAQPPAGGVPGIVGGNGVPGADAGAGNAVKSGGAPKAGSPQIFSAPPPAQAASVSPKSPVADPNNPLASLGLDQVIGPNDIPQPAPLPPGAMRGEPAPAVEERQKEDTDRLADYNREASGGQKIYQDISLLNGTLQRRLNTNKVAPLFTDLTNIAQGLGLKDAIPKGYDPNDAGEFDKVSTDLVFAALKQLPGQPRVSEITGLQRANPNMTLPPATNAAIMQAILANQRWMDTRSRLATEYSARYPGAPLGTFDAAFNAKAPLTDATQLAFDQARKAGFTLPGDAGTPSGASAKIDTAIPSDLPKGSSFIGTYQGKRVFDVPGQGRMVEQ